MIKMFLFALALLFICKLRFPPHRSLYSIVLERYGREGLQALRNYEKLDFKLRKSKADLDFLSICQNNGLTPKFLQFKLYSKNIRDKHEYKNYQKKLLRGELYSKKAIVGSLESEVADVYEGLRLKFSYIDFKHVLTIVDGINGRKIEYVVKTHNKKLTNLGLFYEVEKLSPKKVIFNLSKIKLTNDQETALSLGLDFCFCPTALNYNSYFLSMENLFKRLSQCNIYNTSLDAPNLFRTEFKSLAFQTYYRFKPRPSPFQKEMIQALRQLKLNKEIIVTKPDKGSGTVILDRSDYTMKMFEIINDPDNFKTLQVDLYKHIMKLERRNNRLIDNMVSDGIVTSLVGSNLKTRGSRPGIMYGLPKIHKKGAPMRPILSMSGSFNYNLSRYLVPLLSPLGVNEYCVRDSFSFVKEISEFENKDYVMASFDVKSLFSNVPVKETCKIVHEKFFPTKDSVHEGFNPKLFDKVLNNCIENFFLFDNKIYQQVDGFPMGGCISPTMANIFMCHHESKWLNDCPLEFKPVLYRRYVDDTFLLFRDVKHVPLFQDYLNKKHPRIQFTCEIEMENSLPFLDCKVFKNGDKFETSSYRKPTFTGHGMKYSSAISKKYKLNLVDCLIDRAYKINSTLTNFCLELQRLRKYFTGNGFNIFTLENQISKKLNLIKNPVPVVASAAKRIVYCKIPFLSDYHNRNFEKLFSKIVQEYFPHVNVRLIFSNQFTVGKMFPFKDMVPKCIRSNIVYKYDCGICHSTYIGETTRHYTTRIAEHKGVSPLTGAPMSKVNSHIYQHFLETGHTIKDENFSILHGSNPCDIQLSESIAIHEHKPDLNDRMSSTPLNLLN